MASIDLASNSALLKVAEKLAEQNSLLGAVAVRGERSFVRYSAYADGSDFTETWSAGQNYIGHAVGHEAPTEKEGYEWSLFASNIRETLTVTLPVSGWSKNTQTFETSIIGDGSTVLPTPTPECREAYLAAGVMLTAATETSLIFTCAEVPTIDLVVEVYVTAPMAIIDGGVSSWNDLSDKPFGEVEGISDTVTWDGVINEDDVFDGLQWIHRVTESVPTIEQLNGSTLIVDIDGQEHVIEITDANIGDWEDGNTYDICDESFYYALFVLEDDKTEWYDEDGNALLLKKGVYFEKEQERNMFPKSLLVPGFEFVTTITKKIDSKYLPEVGVSSWNDLTDKPFGGEVVSFGDTLTWDGHENDNTTLITEATADDGSLQSAYLYYASSTILNPEDFVGGTSGGIMFGESSASEITSDKIGMVAENLYALGSELCYMVTEDNVTMENPMFAMTFPKKGIYFMGVFIDGEPMMVGTSLTVPGANFMHETIKKLDPKFINTPDWNAPAGTAGEILNRPFYDDVVELGETLTWDGTVDKNTIKVSMDGMPEGMEVYLQYMSSSTPALEEFYGGTAASVSFGGDNGDNEVVEELTEDNCSLSPDGSPWYVVGPALVALEDNLVYQGTITLPKKGIYFMFMANQGKGTYSSALTIPGYNFVMGDFKKLDSKFIPTPDWNAGKGEEGEILNRPFYDYTQEFGDTVTWDGQTLDETAFMGMIHCYSHSIPTIEEIKTGTIVYHSDDAGDIEIPLVNATVEEDAPNSYTIKASVVHSDGYTYTERFLLVTEPGALFLGIFPAETPGIYTNDNIGSSNWMKSITIPGHNFFKHYHKSIDSSLLPTTDWDAVEGQDGYIKNRPFGKVISTGDTLSKDIGYGEGVSHPEIGMDLFFHMSDVIPTVEDLQSGALYLVDNAGMGGVVPGENAISNFVLNTDTEGIVTVSQNNNAIPFIIVVQTAGSYSIMGASCTFNKTGIYFINLMEMVYVEWLKLPGYEFPSVTVKKIDPMYLPEGIGYDTRESFGDTINYDGSETAVSAGANGMTFYKVSSATPTAEQLVGGSMAILDGDNGEFEIEIKEANIGVADDGKSIVLGGAQDLGEPDIPIATIAYESGATDVLGITYSEPGVYMLSVKAYNIYTTKLYVPDFEFTTGELKKIDPKFLPEVESLPEVTADDNGKVLTVVDGAWAKGESGGSTGGLSLPVVRLSSSFRDGTVLTAEESAEFDIAAQSEYPPIIINYVEGYSMSCFANAGLTDDDEGNTVRIFAISMMGQTVTFMPNGDGLWMVSMSN